MNKKTNVTIFCFALSAYPAFIGPIDELNAIVLRLSSIHNSQEMLLLPHFSSDLNFFGLFERARALRQRQLGQHLVWVCSAALCIGAGYIFM